MTNRTVKTMHGEIKIGHHIEGLLRELEAGIVQYAALRVHMGQVLQPCDDPCEYSGIAHDWARKERQKNGSERI